MEQYIGVIKYAMDNGGNPLFLYHGDKRSLAKSVSVAFNCNVLIAMDEKFTESESDNIVFCSILESLTVNFKPSVIVFDGDSVYRDYYDKLFERFPAARRLCLSKTAFRDDTASIYDTVICEQ